eukprot:CAMPEP_0174865674 /NCGR_PEP_ID=MMETSP1114-20130205/60774_1 /TAXON_ID=312471 /ORGANISM="Neobodo designis, Strain CCAP 1951/1" /LENGTH=107 /DNA_ID=CAMNT_0016100807 /DNA_START=33 /DNA_END=353 /DNA_ORIENTATION=+
MPPKAQGGNEGVAPIAVSSTAGVAKAALEANGLSVTLDKAARTALQRCANIYPLYLAACSDEHWEAATRPKVRATAPLKAEHVAAGEADTGIMAGRMSRLRPVVAAP